MLGRQLAHYEIVELLGEGGMGEVYPPTDTRLGRAVAVEVFPPGVATHAARRRRRGRDGSL